MRSFGLLWRILLFSIDCWSLPYDILWHMIKKKIFSYSFNVEFYHCLNRFPNHFLYMCYKWILQTYWHVPFCPMNVSEEFKQFPKNSSDNQILKFSLFKNICSSHFLQGHHRIILTTGWQYYNICKYILIYS